MNIIFLVESNTTTGGMVRSVISLIDGLSVKPGYNVILACPINSGISKYPFKGKVTIVQPKCGYWMISKEKIFQTTKTAWQIYKLIKPYLKDKAYIVTNGVGASILLSLMPCGKLPEIYVNRGGNLRSDGMAGILVRHKIKYHRIRKAIAISQRQCQLLINEGLNPADVKLIHNGLQLPEFEYTYKDVNKDCFNFSSIGYISDLKNPMVGVDLVKKLRAEGLNAYFHIYGHAESASDKKYKVKLDEYIREQGMADYVVFKGVMRGEDLFKDIDILVSFSKSEGFGRTLVEGMLRMKPVIAWRGAGGPVDITDNGNVCHLVDNNDASAYYDVIKDILERPAENKANVLKSYDYAMNHFTEEIMVQNYINYFDELNNKD